MDRKNLIAAFAVAAALPLLVPMQGPAPEPEEPAGSNVTPVNSTKSGSSHQVPISDHSIRWWKDDPSTSFRVLKENFCQIAQVTFGNHLSPEFRVCLNSGGFRDEDIAVEKPDGVFRTAVLGDAVAFSLGVDNNETLAAYLERRLEDRQPGIEHQTLNFGIPFMTTKEEVIWFNMTGRRYNPDIVVLQYMENDAENLTRIEELREKYYRKLPENMSPERKSMIAGRKAIRQERRERKNTSIEEEMETVEKYLDRLERYSEQDGFRVFVMYYATEFSRRHIPYMREAARERGWGFMVSDLENESYTYADSFYLTPRGNNRTAAGLARELDRQGFLEVNS